MACTTSKVASKPFSDMTGGNSAIRASWCVDNARYNEISMELERLLQENELLGARLQGRKTLDRLDEVVGNWREQIQLKDTLPDAKLDKFSLERGLRWMAQILNQNKRRQVGRKRLKQQQADKEQRPKEQVHTFNSLVTETCTPPVTAHNNESATDSDTSASMSPGQPC